MELNKSDQGKISCAYTQHFHNVKFCKIMALFIVLPPQNGGGYWIRFVALVGPSPICVRSITPLLMEGFPSNLNDTFTSTRGCAEPMLPMCQLKVKVTVKGKILKKQYYTLCRVRSITPLLM